MEAARHLEGLLKPLESSEAEEWIERIVECVAKRNLDSAVVDKDTIVSVVQVGESSFVLATQCRSDVHIAHTIVQPKLTIKEIGRTENPRNVIMEEPRRSMVYKKHLIRNSQ